MLNFFTADNSSNILIQDLNKQIAQNTITKLNAILDAKLDEFRQRIHHLFDLEGS